MNRYAMLRRAAVAAIAGIALLAGCTGAPQREHDANAHPKQGLSRQIIVTLAGASEPEAAATAQELAAAHRLEAIGRFPLASIGVQCLVYRVADGRSPASAMAALRADRRVETVQANQRFGGAGHAEPPPIDDRSRLAYARSALRADAAHRIATGDGVIVAVIDTGVDREHAALREPVASVANFVEDGERSFGRDRHGTAVAGAIAARATGRVGALGIAPRSRIAALKACWHPAGGNGAARCSSWTVARAIDFAIGAGVKVLNLSLTGPDDALIARLLTTADARGITVVAAAAEQGSRGPGFPASLDRVIAVRASDVHGRVAARARAGARPVLAAPGIDVLSTMPGDGYDFVSGSSLAAAHVSGVVALLLERAPWLAPAAVAALLHASARRAAGDAGGAGIVDACNALDALAGRSVCDARDRVTP